MPRLPPCTCHLGELLLTVLSARRNVLLSDVDVIWLVDPEPLLRTLWEVGASL